MKYKILSIKTLISGISFVCFLVLLGIILVLGVLRMLRGKQGKRICFPGYRQVTYRLYRLVWFPVSVFVFHPSVLGFYLFLLSYVMTLDWPVQTGINGIHPVYHLFILAATEM